MKLRIRGNSIRLRLTKGEVETVASAGAHEERTEFGDAALVYRLEAGDVPGPRATLEGGSVTVTLPRADVEHWANSEQVGIEAEQTLAEGSLRILVEKDFKCLAPREGEDQSDAFEHPNADTQSC